MQGAQGNFSQGILNMAVGWACCEHILQQTGKKQDTKHTTQALAQKRDTEEKHTI